MLGRTSGAVLVGVDAREVEVEVDLGKGLPTIAAVGLPDAAVREGIDRVRAALRHAGFELPERRVTINLAPAELPKRGTGLDLPIAVALLVADGKIAAGDTEGALFVGELGLDGRLRPVRGAVSFALATRDSGRRRLYLPRDNADEAALVDGVEVVGLTRLGDLATGASTLRPWRRRPVRSGPAGERWDLADVRGQSGARRALEVAAAGGHHLLMSGPPGSGKTMLARRLPGVLPPLSRDESLEVNRVWSAAGLGSRLSERRPFRSPHHGISLAGMVGGGATLRPGEISLASRGVLYLDELTEFRRDSLEALRQPLEEGSIAVVRVRAAAVFPAEFMLVASMNPCPCGWHGAPDERCRCSTLQIRRYLAKLSGPLLDRFDIVVELPPLDPRAMVGLARGESSERVRERVARARHAQRRRFGEGGSRTNARMPPAELDEHVRPDEEGTALLRRAIARLGLSARAFDRVRRVARTVADIEGAEWVASHHLAEALQYRSVLLAVR